MTQPPDGGANAPPPVDAAPTEPSPAHPGPWHAGLEGGGTPSPSRPLCVVPGSERETSLAARAAMDPTSSVALLGVLVLLLLGHAAVASQEGLHARLDHLLATSEARQVRSRCTELRGLLARERAKVAALQAVQGDLQHKVALQRSELSKSDRQQAALNARLAQERQAHVQREEEADEDRAQSEGASVSYQRKMGAESKTNLDNLIKKSADYSNLDHAHDVLQRDHRSTVASLDELRAEHAALQVEHGQLQAAYSGLQCSFQALQQRFEAAAEEAQERISSLQERCQQVTAEYNNVVSRYNSLLQEYNRLRSYLR